MGDWQILLFLLGGGFLCWLIIRMVRSNPGSFSKEAMSKSIFTLGVLALILLGIILLSIEMIRHV